MDPEDFIKNTILNGLSVLRDADKLTQPDVHGISDILLRALERRRQEKIGHNLSDHPVTGKTTSKEAAKLLMDGCKHIETEDCPDPELI